MLKLLAAILTTVTIMTENGYNYDNIQYYCIPY